MTGSLSEKCNMSKNPMEVEFEYVNWRGERRLRRVIPRKIVFGVAPPFYTEAQWLLEAYDVEKGEDRTFAMKGIIWPWEPSA